jgi:hypothetical protein
MKTTDRLAVLQASVREQKEGLGFYTNYLKELREEIKEWIVTNTTDNKLDLINKGKVQMLDELIGDLTAEKQE